MKFLYIILSLAILSHIGSNYITTIMNKHAYAGIFDKGIKIYKPPADKKLLKNENDREIIPYTKKHFGMGIYYAFITENSSEFIVQLHRRLLKIDKDSQEKKSITRTYEFTIKLSLRNF
jgi:hypothetical protein